MKFHDENGTGNEHADIDYSSLRLAPLQYPYSCSEMYEARRNQVCMKPAAQYECHRSQAVSSLTVASPSSLHIIPTIDSAAGPCGIYASSVGSDGISFEDEKASLSDTDVDEDSDNSDGMSMDDTSLLIRRRKRKTSSQRIQPPCSAKKSCVEERQLNGLISVFNSGLTVVADHLACPASTSVTLQDTTRPIGSSFMHIACNPLICN